MKNRLKSSIISMIAVLSSVILLFVGSCKKQDEVYRKYIEDGEILYLGKTDSLRAYSGYERAKVLWLSPRDPKVEQIKVVWNNGQDSLTVPAERFDKGEFQEIIIENLTEGEQTFVVHSINADGYSSIKSELNARVYGESYVASLLNRFPSAVDYWDHTLNVIFAAAEESVAMTELSYTDINGHEQIAELPDSINNITIDDLDPDLPVTYRTEHLPDSNAIDQFFTAFEELEVPQIVAMPLFITGVMRDAIDDAKNDVDFEYIQLMAATDIDFSKTPFSIVICRNAARFEPDAGAAPLNGWASGGERTYKFDLTAGRVNKGEFFYVGGGSKLMNGQRSTDISDANWIRAKNYGIEDGDGGVGDATSGVGLLPNNGYAFGIGIFMGTNITASSMPIDALFMGDNKSNTLFSDDGSNIRGYRIPNNDLYQTVATDGTPTPFFDQLVGSGRVNMYRVPELVAVDREKGNFVKMGGVFDVESRVWTTPRDWSYIFLEKTSTLSDIETGADVTVIVN